MVEQATLASRELLEIRELLASEMTAMRKLQAGLTGVRDEQLKNLMQTMLEAKKGRIAALNQFTGGLQAGGPRPGQMH